jgi:hypothetical protein
MWTSVSRLGSPGPDGTCVVTSRPSIDRIPVTDPDRCVALPNSAVGL